jgi:hypothetical protein
LECAGKVPIYRDDGALDLLEAFNDPKRRRRFDLPPHSKFARLRLSVFDSSN